LSLRLHGEYVDGLELVRERLPVLQHGDDTTGSLDDLAWLSDALVQLEQWEEAAGTARIATALMTARGHGSAAAFVLAALAEALVH
jgi:hypothetical protein